MWLTSKSLRFLSNVKYSNPLAALVVLMAVAILALLPNVNAQPLPDTPTVQLESSPQWQQTLADAKGETVYFYAWGGSKPINDYLRWAAREIASRYNVRLRHVKVADISEAVSRLKAEDGSKSAIDLLWVNGENFSYLKEQRLLLGKLWSSIPNSALLATQKLPLKNDFGVPIEGFEVPWGVGQFNIIADEGLLGESEQNTVTSSIILAAAKQNPGRISYPRPPEFHGTTFLKQLLVDLSNKDKRLYSAATSQAQDDLLPLLWDYLDQLHPLSWQKGNAFPSSNTEQLSLFQQKQFVLAVSFNPNEMAKEKNEKRIPTTSQRLYFAQGAITNSHNLAIPKAAQNSAGAKVVINFLLSELAQKQKLNGSWGDPSVITPLLDEASTLPAQQELHSSWQQVIEDKWQQKYGA
ncbi:ABC transporter substrate-binding protein [Paraglaciecola sp. 20A4]|uniref:ABC transporter substrate-binding protein n=1 Tax=Paraglaciecola sp. 20A4 TaxID=2687288 RepID=UPI0014098D30|nr:ABC transporter substrate-binding protein [Paraglaciecola sp. 20A4]